MIGPTNITHPPPAPHFKTFRVFLTYFLKLLTTGSQSETVEYLTHTLKNRLQRRCKNGCCYCCLPSTQHTGLGDKDVVKPQLAIWPDRMTTTTTTTTVLHMRLVPVSQYRESLIACSVTMLHQPAMARSISQYPVFFSKNQIILERVRRPT